LHPAQIAKLFMADSRRVRSPAAASISPIQLSRDFQFPMWERSANNFAREMAAPRRSSFHSSGLGKNQVRECLVSKAFAWVNSWKLPAPPPRFVFLA